MARTHGSKNKDRGRVLRAIRNYAGPDADPATKLLELAMQAEQDMAKAESHNERVSYMALASSNYGKLMEYCYPKMRAIDLQAEGDGLRPVVIDMTGLPAPSEHTEETEDSAIDTQH